MTQDAPRGRLFVVSAARPQAQQVATALAARLDRSITIDGSTFDEMIVSGREPEPAEDTPAEAGADLDRIRQRLLRWSAALAVAETYQLEGFDAVITDELRGEHLEDFLDLAAPETVLLVVLDDGTDLATPRWGLWVRSPDRPAADVADVVLSRLDEALVLTTE